MTGDEVYTIVMRCMVKTEFPTRNTSIMPVILPATGLLVYSPLIYLYVPCVLYVSKSPVDGMLMPSASPRNQTEPGVVVTSYHTLQLCVLVL